MTTHLRILLANEPRLYREMLAIALGSLVPTATIQICGDADRAKRLTRFAPQLVISGTPLVPPLPESVLTYMLLYPDNADLALVMNESGERLIPEVTLADLVQICKETEQTLARQGEPEIRYAAEPSLEWDDSVLDP